MSYLACGVSSLYHVNLLQLVNELAEFVICYTYLTYLLLRTKVSSSMFASKSSIRIKFYYNYRVLLSVCVCYVFFD